MKNSKSLFVVAAIGLAVLIGWFVYSHHKQVLAARQAEEAFFNAEETFQLPAENGGNTSFKDIENSFRNGLSPRYQSVSVKSIELVCNIQKMSHQVDDRISGAEVAQSIAHGENYNRKDMAAINRYNDYARHGTVSDGSDMSWGVNVSITHRVRKSSDSTTPLSLEWVCPDPSAASRLPIHPSDDLPTIALMKYGIQITHTKEEDMVSHSWEAEGLLGTNKFTVNIADLLFYLDPKSKTLLFGSPITQLKWNGDDVYCNGDLKGFIPDWVKLNNPVLSQPEIKNLATWALDYITKQIADEKGEDVEVTGAVEVGNDYRILIKSGSNYNDWLVLSGPLAKPLLDLHLAHPGVYTVKGRKIRGATVVVHSLTISAN